MLGEDRGRFGSAGKSPELRLGAGVRCPELPIQRNWNGTVQNDVLLRRRGLQSVAHVTCAAVGIALAAKLFRGICGTGRDENLLYHKKTFRKLPAIFVAMLVALLIFAVDLTVTAATLASKRANARLPPDQAFYVLDALPLLSTVLVPLLYFCDRNGKNSRQAAENDSGATSVEVQSPKPTRRGSYGALSGANRPPN